MREITIDPKEIVDTLQNHEVFKSVWAEVQKIREVVESDTTMLDVSHMAEVVVQMIKSYEDIISVLMGHTLGMEIGMKMVIAQLEKELNKNGES